MSENIFLVTITKIKEGKLEDLKLLMNEMSEATKINEPDALRYEWFISEDEKYCHLIELYKDSPSTVLHLKSFFKNFMKGFLENLEIKSFTAYGNPSEDLKGMLSPAGGVKMYQLGGFAR